MPGSRRLSNAATDHQQHPKQVRRGRSVVCFGPVVPSRRRSSHSPITRYARSRWGSRPSISERNPVRWLNGRSLLECRDNRGRLWQCTLMATQVSFMEIRSVPIPRRPVIEMVEAQWGGQFTHQRRHYVAGEPVHCGDMLEAYVDGSWIVGRYDWTTDPDEEPTLQTQDRVFSLNGSHLLRWPKWPS